MHGVGCWTKAHIFRQNDVQERFYLSLNYFSDRKPIYLHQGALVSPFSLEVLQHILSHLDSLPINQVELILLSFGSSPKIPPMSFKLSLLTTHLLPGGSSAHDIEGWDLVDVVLHVERLYPLVYGGHLVPPVDIGGAALTIVRKPDQFWRLQEWRHSKGVTPTWVKFVLVSSIKIKSPVLGRKGLKVPALHQVVEPSDEQNPHWPRNLPILDLPGK